MNLTTLKIATYLDIMDMLVVDARSLFTVSTPVLPYVVKTRLAAFMKRLVFALSEIIELKPSRVGNHPR